MYKDVFHLFPRVLGLIAGWRQLLLPGQGDQVDVRNKIAFT